MSRWLLCWMVLCIGMLILRIMWCVGFFPMGWISTNEIGFFSMWRSTYGWISPISIVWRSHDWKKSPKRSVRCYSWRLSCFTGRGHHSAMHTTAKVISREYYGPTLYQDVKSLVKKCAQCQKQGVSWRHELPLIVILEVELFDAWEIDFMGPFVSS